MLIQNKTIEDVILSYSKRGMDELRENMEPYFCKKAAQKILSLKRGVVFLTTGFFVNGYAETDGPPGTMALVKALKKLGFEPYILTDTYLKGYFEPLDVSVIYVNVNSGREYYESLLKKYRPVCLIAVERCGKNWLGYYGNANGENISSYTADIDVIFELAKGQHIVTIGIGDGGNEIGMGKIKDILEQKLSIMPCQVSCDHLIIATVSNWGAYGVVAYMRQLSDMQVIPTTGEIKQYLRHIVSLGCIDGITREHTMSVDQFPVQTELNILDQLRLKSMEV